MQVPCPVDTITYTNITQAPGTSVAQLIDFEVSDEIEAKLTRFWHMLGII
eukprot:COSAG04_NODE_8550_length_959_cov_1.209302_3_plen_50_part_00